MILLVVGNCWSCSLEESVKCKGGALSPWLCECLPSSFSLDCFFNKNINSSPLREIFAFKAQTVVYLSTIFNVGAKIKLRP